MPSNEPDRIPTTPTVPIPTMASSAERQPFEGGSPGPENGAAQPSSPFNQRRISSLSFDRILENWRARLRALSKSDRSHHAKMAAQAR